MKRYFLITFLAFLNLTSFGQGILFSQGTWKEMLAKAKAEDKLIFVDVYTSWCGPCKKMAAEVFPLKEVGDVFNPTFVSYKIDAEKGEGIQIAKQFSVKSYPTYLFVNGDGILVYRSGSYNAPKIFLNEAAMAIKEKYDPKPLAKWEDEYNAGKRDREFLMGYIKKRALVKVPNGILLDETFPLMSSEDLLNKEFLSPIMKFEPNMTFVPGGKFYNYVIDHYKEIDQIIGKKDGYTLSILEVGIQQYFNVDIIKNNKEKMLPVMLATKKQLMELQRREEIDVTLKGLIMNYYKGTQNVQKLVPAALDYVNNGLLKLDIAGKQADDKVQYQKKRAPYLNGTEDSTKVENWTSKQRTLASPKMVEVSYKLRDAAQAIYATVEDPKLLAQAIEWAKKAESYFPHFSIEAVYAGLLLKLGNKKEAAEMMMKASGDSFIKDGDKQKLLLSNVLKIRNGEVPEQLW